MGFWQKLGRRARAQDIAPNETLGAGEVAVRMQRLAAAGRAREAVAFALPHAVRLDDADLHRELTELRRDAAAEAIAAATPRSDWPPRYPDPFPGAEGIPEIAGDALTTAIVGGAIQHHGSLLVRGLLPREEATALAAQVDRAFAAHDATWMGRECAEDAAWYAPFPLDADDKLAQARLWNRQGGGVLAADCPAMLNRLAALFERRGLTGLIEGHLGERPMLSVGKTVLRRAEPERGGDFHQDGAFLGADVRTINVWIALSACGVDSPGLEIVDRRVPAVLETGTEGAWLRWSIGRPVAQRANGGRPFARPVFAPGDAMIFDQLMVHATSHDPAMSRPRFAVESWFFAPSAYTEEQVPLAI